MGDKSHQQLEQYLNDALEASDETEVRYNVRSAAQLVDAQRVLERRGRGGHDGSE
jgi:hypothetical protein